MKFTVGYQRNDALKEEVMRHTDKICEIYFPWGNFTTGRGVIANSDSQRAMETDLEEYVGAGLKTNLLLNGNCYGRYAQARTFYQSVGDAISELIERFDLSSVTTTSPIIAKFIKGNFPELEVRASVNMEIGSPEGVEYMAQWFDGFYLKREYNWHYEKLTAMRAWCNSLGKKLYLLANSGCLNYCSARSFHDNLVAHQHEIAEMDNAFEFKGVCHEFIRSENNKHRILNHCNFIRPEDMHLFEGLCDGVKLATRTNRNPSAVVKAYCDAHFAGNLLDLTEPSHSQSLYPSVVENARIPEEYAKFRLHCSKQCQTCGYCDEVQKKATLNLEHIGIYGKTDK